MVSLEEVAKGIRRLVVGNEFIKRQVQANTVDLKDLRKDMSELSTTIARIDGKMDILISDHTTVVNVVKDIERLKVKVEALEHSH